jgi:hypothetical protein
MLFTQDANEWLNQVDPWYEGEALDLLDAAQNGRSVGVFDCAMTTEGARWFVMAAHAERVLVLTSPDAWQAFIVELIDRFELRHVGAAHATGSRQPARELVGWTERDAAERAANESRRMQLLEQASMRH